MAITYARNAEALAHQLNKKLLAEGASTFCLLRNEAGDTSKAKGGDWWLAFTDQRTGDMLHTTSVIGKSAKEACIYLKGYLDAVYWLPEMPRK